MEDRLMKKNVVALIATVLVLAAAIAAAASNDWIKVSVSPYRGTPDQAFAQMVLRGVSSAEIMTARRHPEYVTLKKGQSCPGGFMISGAVDHNGNGKIMPNPNFVWQDRETVNATQYRLNPNAVVWHVDACNNWVYCPGAPATIASTPPTPAPLTPPATRKTIEVTTLEDNVTLHAYFIKLNDISKQLVRKEGRQNRDLSDAMLDALSEKDPAKKVEYFEWKKDGPCPAVKFAFLEANYDAARGKPIQVVGEGTENGDIPDKFSATANVVSPRLCKGYASVTVPRELFQTAEKRARMAVEADSRLSVYYPPSKRVTSCSGRGDDSQLCGRSKWVNETSEFYGRVLRVDPARNIEYFFVIRE